MWLRPAVRPAPWSVFGLLTGVRSGLGGHRGRRLTGPRDGAARPVSGRSAAGGV